MKGHDLLIRESRRDEIEQLIPLLLLANPFERILRYDLENCVDSVYVVNMENSKVGAAALRWRGDPCEIKEIAIASEHQGQGLGRQFVAWLIEEARRREKPEIVVGTANNSIFNIIFYQKCGFRMDHVRHDFFSNYPELPTTLGVRACDMLMFRYDVQAGKRP